MNFALSIKEENDQEIKGLLLETCANRSSVMYKSQFEAYCKKFNSPTRLRPATGKVVRGFGGRHSGICMAKIPVPFLSLCITIDVDFLITDHAIPTLLSMKDIF